MVAPLRHGPWTLADLETVPRNGLKVFSCFHGGGGSTMGYKLAGFDVLGGVEIDQDMMEIYRKNHKPKFSYEMGIQDFNRIPDVGLPDQLFDLDILDGSPPCSSFSMSGARERKWGTKFRFREGQAEQVIDDLFFHFIETAGKLRPKVIVAENVKGLIIGNARGYVKEIFEAIGKAGYSCQLFLLNASRMGVPQRRERVFFIARRDDLGFSDLALNFEEPEISVKEAFAGITTRGKDQSGSKHAHLYDLCKPGDYFSDYHPKGYCFTWLRLPIDSPAPTLLGSAWTMFHFESMRNLSNEEYFSLQTFPRDFKVSSNILTAYLCGMSVPPFMIQRIADQIEQQWLGAVPGPSS